MATLSKLSRVQDSITIYRYDNGWMVEVSGNDADDNWATAKIICNTEDEVLDLVKQYNATEMDA